MRKKPEFGLGLCRNAVANTPAGTQAACGGILYLWKPLTNTDELGYIFVCHIDLPLLIPDGRRSLLIDLKLKYIWSSIVSNHVKIEFGFDVIE